MEVIVGVERTCKGSIEIHDNWDTENWMLHHINTRTIYHNCQEAREIFVPVYSSVASLKLLKWDHVPGDISGLAKPRTEADMVGWSVVALEISTTAQLCILLG